MLGRLIREIRIRREVKRIVRTYKLINRLIEDDSSQALIIVGRINKHHAEALAGGRFQLIFPYQRVVYEEEVNARSGSIRSQN